MTCIMQVISFYYYAIYIYKIDVIDVMIIFQLLFYIFYLDL